MPYNDLGAAREAIGANTCAVIVEPIQGEGGVLPADPAFLKGLREACDQHGALLIFDEVQTGVGRTGSFYAYMDYGVTPDILTTAKALGNGFPIGAMLTTNDIAAHFKVGVHGTTYGGNPLGASIAEKVVELISDPKLLEGVHATQRGDQGASRAHQRALFAVQGDSRQGPPDRRRTDRRLQGPREGRAERSGREHGVIMLIAGPNVLRFAPSLIMPMADLDEGFARIEKAIAEVVGEAVAAR